MVKSVFHHSLQSELPKVHRRRQLQRFREGNHEEQYRVYGRSDADVDFDILPLLRVRSRALNGGGLGPEAGRGHLPPRGGLRPSERPQVRRGLLQARSLREGGPIRRPRRATQPPQKRGSDPQTAADHPQRTPRTVAQGRRGDHRQSVLLRAGSRRGERRQLLRGGAAVAGLL